MALIVSRNDIATEVLTEYPADERGIKLPINSYLQLLGLEPNSTQKAIINAYNNPKYRFIVAAVSRRQGKTYIANIIGQMVTLVPNCNVLIMSPNYNLSTISFELQQKFIKHFDLEMERNNMKDRIIELSNGSTIRMGSVNQVDSVVGRSYDLIIFDEAALSTEGEAAFNVALRPTLDKTNSKAIFISTPRGKKNWFSRFYQRGFSPEHAEWVSIHADYEENPRISASDIAEARRTMSSAEFEQEYMASFNIYEGQIFKFNGEECLQDLSELDLGEMDVIAGLDIGYRDATAFCVVGFDWKSEKYYVLDEYLNNEANTAEHAEAVQKFSDKYNIDFIFIDSAAAQVREDFMSIYDIATINAKKSINDGIAFIQTLVDNNRLIVDYRCTNLIDTLDQYRWDDNEKLLKERPIHDQYSHMADALRYAIYSYIVTTGTV